MNRDEEGWIGRVVDRAWGWDWEGPELRVWSGLEWVWLRVRSGLGAGPVGSWGPKRPHPSLPPPPAAPVRLAGVGEGPRAAAGCPQQHGPPQIPEPQLLPGREYHLSGPRPTPAKPPFSPSCQGAWGPCPQDRQDPRVPCGLARHSSSSHTRNQPELGVGGPQLKAEPRLPDA